MCARGDRCDVSLRFMLDAFSRDNDRCRVQFTLSLSVLMTTDRSRHYHHHTLSYRKCITFAEHSQSKNESMFAQQKQANNKNKPESKCIHIPRHEIEMEL